MIKNSVFFVFLLLIYCSYVKQHQGEAPPKPTRGKKTEGSTESLDVASDDEKPAYEVNIRDIVPRVDITPQITDALISELSDKDWKVMIKTYICIKHILLN